ncbi:CAP domain-containing protein [Bacillus infantis]|uniref:CAP domain-containing protein n=1 Tax=Bacillus infantis TaxID=324767 RepID=UPI001CD34758|nr:CAP domain-containing protein [Bacillus infantis]MCA1039985.1 CAP domain-containing protein [Bacillus infantis]
MNKKVIFSVAAAAALLVSPGFNKADAASNCPTPQQVKVNYSGNLNNKQINSLLQKYLKQYNISWENVQVNKQPVQAEQPKQEAPAPAKAEQPKQETPAPAKAEQPKQEAPAPAPAKQPAPAEQPKAAPSASQVSAFEQKVFELTNQERAKNGVPALKLDTELSKVAREKSNDMKTNGYFDHNSPTYGSPFDMMKKFGISYRTAGENIAMGQRSPEEVVKAWMNSEGHRKNILNASFTHIGVGHVAEGNYWTQQFIGK